jgi:hypothetical protein
MQNKKAQNMKMYFGFLMLNINYSFKEKYSLDCLDFSTLFFQTPATQVAEDLI